MRVRAAVTVRRSRDELERLWAEVSARDDVVRHLDLSDLRLEPAPGDRGTEIHVDVDASPRGGVVGARVAKVFGEDPEQNVKDDLRRFKQVAETGEVVRSDATLSGHSARAQLRQRPAQPVGSGS